MRTTILTTTNGGSRPYQEKSRQAGSNSTLKLYIPHGTRNHRSAQEMRHGTTWRCSVYCCQGGILVSRFRRMPYLRGGDVRCGEGRASSHTTFPPSTMTGSSVSWSSSRRWSWSWRYVQNVDHGDDARTDDVVQTMDAIRRTQGKGTQTHSRGECTSEERGRGRLLSVAILG